MRKVFERLTDSIRQFIAQRDDVALVVRCPEAESAVMLRIFDELQEHSSTEMFWVFAEEFTTPAEYVDEVVAHFAAIHATVRAKQQEEGGPCWPAAPPSLFDRAAPPVARMRAAMVFARSLLPDPSLVIVWALFPLKIENGEAHAGFVRELLQHEFPFPWCHHMRIVIRDGGAPGLETKLGKPPRVAWLQPEIGPAAIARALDEDLADDSLPLEQQMQSLVISAALDYSHKRYDQALDKYKLLLRFYNGTKNLPMSALVLNQIGEAFLAKGNAKEANEVFLAAVIPATEGDPPPIPVLTNILWNLAGLRLKDKNWPEAEAYFHELQKLAAIQRNPSLKVTAIEQLGVAQFAQGKRTAAATTWRAGAQVAEQLDLPEQRDAIMKRLRELDAPPPRSNRS